MDLGMRHVTQLTDVVRTGGPAFGHDMRFTEDPAYTAKLEVGFFRVFPVAGGSGHVLVAVRDAAPAPATRDEGAA
jgi:hypothetical protein